MTADLCYLCDSWVVDAYMLKCFFCKCRTPSNLRRFGSGGTLNKQHVFESKTCVLPMTCNAVSYSYRKISFLQMWIAQWQSEQNLIINIFTERLFLFNFTFIVCQHRAVRGTALYSRQRVICLITSTQFWYYSVMTWNFHRSTILTV